MEVRIEEFFGKATHYDARDWEQSHDSKTLAEIIII